MPLRNKSLTIASILFMLLMVSACSLKAIKKQSIELENLAQISGKVTVKGDTGHPVVVAAITYSNNKATIIDQRHIAESGDYQLNLLPGKYLIGAYVDKNSNFIRDDNESAAMFSKNEQRFTDVILANKQKLTLPTIVINPQQYIEPAKKIHYNSNKIKANIGRVISLNDAIFAKENSDMGLWRPIDFLKEIGGGLMFLQPFDSDKTPVIFIHGLSGNPTEFSEIIRELDNTKFQPWVLYYPSGLPLDLVSNYLLTTLIKLHTKHNFSELQLISHSMGGMIARDFLHKQQTIGTQFSSSLYVTINSPMYGLDNAARGVEESPIVIASWRDLASNSDYVKSLHQWTIPKSIPYHLFFTYLPGEDGDGNVPMSSQLSLSLQNEAKRIYANQGSHTGVLADERFIERLIKVMLAPNK